jgi:two-component system, NarL family, nitrate/nitrite response regulator NarL
MNVRVRARALEQQRRGVMNEPTPDRVRVVAVEDDATYRASLEILLRHSDDFRLVATFEAPADALGALELATRRGSDPGWDLVLMDLGLPGMTGAECTRRVKDLLPEVAVVALTVFEDRASILEAICAGADGYLLKQTAADQLLAQLRVVVAGGSPLSAGVATTVLEVVRQIDEWRIGRPGAAPVQVGLTPREHEVLACLVEGMSYKAVAARLGISIDTVRFHIRSIYRKLRVNSVVEAVGRALKEGLV